MLSQPQCVADTVFNMCLNPINAELQEFGKPKFTHEGALKLPCGKCTECKSQRAVQWAIRARHEIALHDENCFLTLTYEDKNLPSHLIVKDPFQRFMKRLRKHVKKPLRYMVSHEYGSQHFRPHHHAIIFGWNPKEQYEQDQGQHQVYTKMLCHYYFIWIYSKISLQTRRKKNFI